MKNVHEWSMAYLISVRVYNYFVMTPYELNCRGSSGLPSEAEYLRFCIYFNVARVVDSTVLGACCIDSSTFEFLLAPESNNKEITFVLRFL